MAAAGAAQGGGAEWYFDSYSSLPMQEVMLRDGVRTRAYRDAILGNRALFEDAVVIDVGCGTGILSVYAAQAGARAVYAIEASGAAAIAREVVAENSVGDRVRVVHGTVEQLAEGDGLREGPEGPPVQADVLISEWMGFALTVETMLPSVLRARDKWLRPGGRLFPETARLLAAPFADPEPDFWDDVHGVKMTCVRPRVAPRGNGPDAIFDCVPGSACWLQRPAAVLCDWDLTALSVEAAAAQLEATWEADGGGRRFDGMCLWFVVAFPGGSELTTEPGAPETHWRQTLLFVQPQQRQQVPTGAVLRASLRLGPAEGAPRYLCCALEWEGGEGCRGSKRFPRIG
eukprot:TRINITY_DN8838_c0_g1_i2.p2 TRINITY_DN8838_c0_g1~~TRINITY_DN8838_c0_g1_i2.p2  ORF type:complete len:369 (+),score=140.79 TRINITY_DN8838_c0_g1_i2:78-1109(+)